MDKSLESIFDGFVVLESFQVDDALVRLRFVPSFFEVGYTHPVLCVDVSSCAEPESAPRKLAAIQQGSVGDIRVDPKILEVWFTSECKEPPVVFQGSVTWSREDYGLADYIRLVEDRNRFGEEMRSQVSRLRSTIDRVTGFIDRAIDRTERKQVAIESGDDRYAKELQLLRSIRRQFSNDW